MACKYYNNNGYSCAGCVHFVKTIAVELSDDLIIFTIPEQVFNNHDKICLCIAQAIPDGVTGDTKVQINLGTATLAKIPVVTRRGNFLYADAIKSRKVYPLTMATDTGAFVLEDMCKLGPTAHVFPTVPAVFPPPK